MRKFILMSIFILILDQATKLIIASYIPYESYIEISSFFKLVNFHNTGAAFSFLHNAGGWQRYFLIFITLIAVVWIIFMLVKNKHIPIISLGLLLILGGALGNLIDRIRLGYVVDFIYLHIDSWYWPAFNIADSAICFGAGLLVYDMFKRKDHV
ncbi:signal peptidase II [Methylophilaceae bacterium]|nr:signal peptidase II [Methylophilaceae bacterium]MDC1173061.1 signal peptidase II [Methylophilaceae bacterium]